MAGIRRGSDNEPGHRSWQSTLYHSLFGSLCSFLPTSWTSGRTSAEVSNFWYLRCHVFCYFRVVWFHGLILYQSLGDLRSILRSHLIRCNSFVEGLILIISASDFPISPSINHNSNPDWWWLKAATLIRWPRCPVSVSFLSIVVIILQFVTNCNFEVSPHFLLFSRITSSITSNLFRVTPMSN